MNIILACAGGMSTSFIVSRMKKAAEEEGLKGKIWAVAKDDLDYEEGFDVVLIGPQIAKDIDEVREDVGDVPVAVIPKDMYGKCDGKAILQLAKDTLEANS